MSENGSDNRKDTTAAWAFVARNSRTLWWATNRACARIRVNRDEFHSDLCLDVVERFDGFDPARGSESNWIWMRARALRRSTTRREVRFERAGAAAQVQDPLPGTARNGRPDRGAPPVPVPAGVRGNADRVVAAAELVDLVRLATPIERIAVHSYLRDWSQQVVTQRFGSVRSRDIVLQRFGDRIAAGA